MSKRSSLVYALLVSSFIAVGCKDEPKPAPAATPSAAPKPAATPSAAAPKPADAKPAASAAAKPDKAHKKSLPAAKAPHPVPTDWIELTDDVRGFSFSVPKGSTGAAQDKGGVGVFLAVLPKPSDKVGTMVIAYKDAKKSLDDLEKDAEGVISKVFEEANVKEGKKTDITDDYRLVEFTSEDAKDHTKSHWKALLATDVTDNYIMVIGTPEADFKANEPTIDTMWGSFDMFSGGHSGDSH
jgi:hypothetical protein